MYTAELPLETKKEKVVAAVAYYYIPCTYLYPEQDERIARECEERKTQGMEEEQVREKKMKRQQLLH